ncbi:MAG TPA: multicopper oxidase domain-containing protein [Candidatus Saccharimonadaceae bacterium]|jgi:nitrite reductase (NO-forming)|nr:multicopper oxidase domain-containing protein [Candidatus Saccharimonadaceae bacterium]
MWNVVERRRRFLSRGVIAGAALAAVLAGCGKGSDPYDESRMDLHPKPASISDVRHTGDFATGSALSTAPAVARLDPAPVKDVHIDIVDRVVDLAPGVHFDAWTLGGSVPGPVIRARVGDRIRFSMTNRSDETIPGVPSFPMPMMHSIDFHAAMVSPQDKYRSIAPGQTIQFEFQLNYPGVFMYHCGTPMILEHIASGMYGMFIVEPRAGYPTNVDREYAVIQSEFYAKPDPGHRKVGGDPLYVLDAEKVRTKASTYTVFNGAYNSMVDHPLTAKPGERVRLYVLNVGPSNTSSFHVVGTIFDRVWVDGNPDNQFRGMQTVLLGSSSAAIVEFRVPEKGKYVMVDHHFANASQGAIGILDATGETAEPGAPSIEHHNFSATAAVPTEPEAVAGKLLFESKCLVCHSIGQGPKIGPDLAGVAARRTDLWITHWLQSPEKMLASDDTAKVLLKRFNLPMPNQNLSADEIHRLIQYFHWTASGEKPGKPAGE